MKRQPLALAAAVLALFVSAARGEEWPTHPVRIVNTFAAGGTVSSVP